MEKQISKNEMNSLVQELYFAMRELKDASFKINKIKSIAIGNNMLGEFAVEDLGYYENEINELLKHRNGKSGFELLVNELIERSEKY
jgi:hypothetical protein